jgi:3-hydroxyisobutyrate dehydrogenase
MRIAFVGLGNMGAPMARNLLAAGHELVVVDLVPAAVDSLTAAGAHAADSAKSAAIAAELVITMLPASPQVRQVYEGAEGILAGVAAGVPLIDSSTIDPHTARAVAAAAAAHGNPMADAPVSGGTSGAASGSLTFMVGADSALFERIKPVLAAMGKTFVHCGGPGNGQVAKICNNLVLGISMLAVAEAMNLGVRLGMDPKVLAAVINSSSGRCWSSDTYNPYPGVLSGAPAARGYTGGFGTDLMLKDLGLATEAARHSRQPVAMAALAQQLYQLWSTRSGARKDFSSIIELLQHD